MKPLFNAPVIRTNDTAVVYQPVADSIQIIVNTRQFDNINLIDAFIRQLSCVGSSRKLYARVLPLFFKWCRETGKPINALLKEDIQAYADALINGTIQKQHYVKPKTIKEDNPNIKHRVSRKQRAAMAAAVSVEVMEQPKPHTDADKLSPLTAKAYLTAVRLYFEYLSSIGAYANIAAGVKIKSKHIPQDNQREELTPTEAATLAKLAIADATPRDAAIVNLLLLCGLRTIEVIRANVGDIIQEGDHFIMKVQGKGRITKDNHVVITPKLKQLIDAYLSTRTDIADDAPLFTAKPRNAEYLYNNAKTTLNKIESSLQHCVDIDTMRQLENAKEEQLQTLNDLQSGRMTTRTISGIAKKYMKAAGINTPTKTAHSLRHTFGCMVLDETNDYNKVRLTLRHASVNTTYMYVHHKDRQMKAEIAATCNIENILGI